jgi:hypothetical protein
MTYSLRRSQRSAGAAAMSEVQLDAEYDQAIAEQVANEVIAHFNVVEKDSTTRR